MGSNPAPRTMLYELHITSPDRHRQLEWDLLTYALGGKPLMIELDSGEHPLQMMNAFTFDGEIYMVDAWIADVLGAYSAKNFKIERTKLEIPLDHSSGYNSVYFEAHVKMLLTEKEEMLLPAAAQASGMHVSCNTLKKCDASYAKWYLTRRVYGGDFRNAAVVLNDAYRRVLTFLPSVRMEAEAVIFDTNPGLDAGWAA